MHEMEGPSPGLRGESCPISRAPFSPLGLHRTSDHLKRRLPAASAAVSRPREVSPGSSDLSSVAFRLGDVSFLLPPTESRKGFDQRFQDLPSLHSSIHRIRMVIPRPDKFLHRLSTSGDEVRPRDGSRCRRSSTQHDADFPGNTDTTKRAVRVRGWACPADSCHAAPSGDGGRSPARTAPRRPSGSTTCSPPRRAPGRTRDPILLDVDPAAGLTRQTVDLALQLGRPARRLARARASC